MTGPQGFTEVYGRFSAELDSAVARAKRVGAQAREASERFRRQTAELAKSGPGRPAAPGSARGSGGALAGSAPGSAATPEALRRAATGFRTDHGLPVREQPKPPAAETPVTPQPDPSAPVPPSAGVLTNRWEPAPPRRIAPSDDDDEDFSQERILS
jgi:hypothetical protein